MLEDQRFYYTHPWIDRIFDRPTTNTFDLRCNVFEVALDMKGTILWFASILFMKSSHVESQPCRVYVELNEMRGREGGKLGSIHLRANLLLVKMTANLNPLSLTTKDN